MKKKEIAVLLAMFTCVFGGHHFYLRNNVRALLYFVFSWTLIPGVLSLGDALWLLSMDDETFDKKYNSKL